MWQDQRFVKLFAAPVTSQPQTVETDLDTVASVEQLQIVFQEKFQFPGFSDRIWDAFGGSITGPVVLPPWIRLLSWQRFEPHFPRDAGIIRECFTEYRKEVGASASEIEYA